MNEGSPCWNCAWMRYCILESESGLIKDVMYVCVDGDVMMECFDRKCPRYDDCDFGPYPITDPVHVASVKILIKMRNQEERYGVSVGRGNISKLRARPLTEEELL